MVAETSHQLEQRAADAAVVPAGLVRRAGKTEARQRGNDDVERLARPVAMRRGVGQGLDQIQELYNRPRPAVDEKERLSGALSGLHVDEVDRLAIDLGGELGEAVDRRFVRPPIITVEQPADGASYEGLGGAVAPARVLHLARQNGVLKAPPEVVEGRGGNIDHERGDVGHFEVSGTALMSRRLPSGPAAGL